jgi:hypothetical protein
MVEKISDYSIIISLACDADRATRTPQIYRTLREQLTIEDLLTAWRRWEKPGCVQ